MRALEVVRTWWDWIFRSVRIVRGEAGTSGPGRPQEGWYLAMSGLVSHWNALERHFLGSLRG